MHIPVYGDENCEYIHLFISVERLSQPLRTCSNMRTRYTSIYTHGYTLLACWRRSSTISCSLSSSRKACSAASKLAVGNEYIPPSGMTPRFQSRSSRCCLKLQHRGSKLPNLAGFLFCAEKKKFTWRFRLCPIIKESPKTPNFN